MFTMKKFLFVMFDRLLLGITHTNLDYRVTDLVYSQRVPSSENNLHGTWPLFVTLLGHLEMWWTLDYPAPEWPASVLSG